MPRSVRVEMILDTLRAVRGAKDLSKATGDTAKAFGDTAREGKRAGEAVDAVGEEMSDAARATAMLDREVDKLTGSLREMAIAQTLAGDNSFAKQIREQESQLRRLTRNRKLFEDAGDDGAQGFVARFSARVGPLLASAPISPALLAAAAPAVPGIGALMASAVIGGAAGVGIVGGLVLAARDERVKAAGADLGEMVLGDLERRAEGFVQPTLNSIERVRRGWWSLDPDLDRIFDSHRFVEPLVDGAITGARAVVGGIADAVDEADPVVESFRQLLAQTGTAAGDTFTLLAQDSRQAASAVEDLTMAVSNMVTTTGYIVHAGAQVHGYLGEVDKVIDRTRYWIEDNNRLDAGLEHLGFTTDWTADGFRKGSVEAEAYRKATLGTAQAADFAILKQAGMTDAQIAGVDASGKYRAELARVKAQTDAVAASSNNAVATQETLTAAQKQLTAAQQAYSQSLDQLGPKQGRAAQLMDGLRKASQNLYGAAIAGSEANEEYEASWDALSESVKGGSRSLDVHTSAGRANRNSLQALLSASNEMYFANIAQGKSTDQARVKHEARTAAVREEARRLGLNKEQTEALIRTYGRIPGRKITDLILDGLNEIAIQLRRVYLAQRALAEGKTVNQVRYEGTAAMRSIGLAAGGRVHGAGPRGVDSVPIVAAPGEFMHRTAAVDYYGVGAMEALNAKKIPREALQGYATGGLIAPVETRRRIPMVVDVGDSYVMPLKLALSKVTPSFGNWPSSPAAQRGDSGVWRRIHAMVKASGIPVDFGNAYRPGDPKWHGSGRAIDYMGYNQDRLARFFLARQSQVLEMIHRTSARDYAYTRGRNMGSFNSALMRAHLNHLHIAMDDEWFHTLQPGLNVVRNGTGRPEPVAGPKAMAAMSGGWGSMTIINNNYVTVQAGYVVSERDLQDKITATVDTLVRKGRV